VALLLFLELLQQVGQLSLRTASGLTHLLQWVQQTLLLLPHQLLEQLYKFSLLQGVVLEVVIVQQAVEQVV
jgi:hypothetical protein